MWVQAAATLFWKKLEAVFGKTSGWGCYDCYLDCSKSEHGIPWMLNLYTVYSDLSKWRGEVCVNSFASLTVFLNYHEWLKIFRSRVIVLLFTQCGVEDKWPVWRVKGLLSGCSQGHLLTPAFTQEDWKCWTSWTVLLKGIMESQACGIEMSEILDKVPRGRRQDLGEDPKANWKLGRQCVCECHQSSAWSGIRAEHMLHDMRLNEQRTCIYGHVTECYRTCMELKIWSY